MAASDDHNEEGKRLLEELKNKGVVDLDSLVRKITSEPGKNKSPQRLLCNIPEHYCIVVREKE